MIRSRLEAPLLALACLAVVPLAAQRPVATARPPALQLGGYAAQLNGLLDAFASAKDSPAAAAALDAVHRQVEGLARLVAGT
jgi:hypothetical protein